MEGKARTISIKDIKYDLCTLEFEDDEIHMLYDYWDEEEQIHDKCILWFTDFSMMERHLDIMLEDSDYTDEIWDYLYSIIYNARVLTQFRDMIGSDERVCELYAQFLEDHNSLMYDTQCPIPVTYDKNGKLIGLRDIDFIIAKIVSKYQFYRYIFHRNKNLSKQAETLTSGLRFSDTKVDTILYDAQQYSSEYNVIIVGDLNDKTETVHESIQMAPESSYPEMLNASRIKGIAKELLSEQDYKSFEQGDISTQNKLTAKLALIILDNIENDSDICDETLGVSRTTIFFSNSDAFSDWVVTTDVSEGTIETKLQKLKTLGVQYEKWFGDCSYDYYTYSIQGKQHLITEHNIVKCDEYI